MVREGGEMAEESLEKVECVSFEKGISIVVSIDASWGKRSRLWVLEAEIE